MLRVVPGVNRHYSPAGPSDLRWLDAPFLTNSMLGNGWIEWYSMFHWSVRHDLTLPFPYKRRAFREQLCEPTVPFGELW
jgi:hypothetical protein